MHINNLFANLPQPVSQNYFLAYYAASLIQGKPISGSTIQSSTIKNYIHVARDLLPATSQHTPHSCKTDFVNIIMRMLQNYKSIPERSMITNEMTLWRTKHIPTLAPTHPFIMIFDWVILGCYAGFHTSEWCQTLQHTYKHITSWPLQPPEAFITEDFKFYLDRKIPVANITMHPSATGDSVHIWWHMQKNK